MRRDDDEDDVRIGWYDVVGRLADQTLIAISVATLLPLVSEVVRRFATRDGANTTTALLPIPPTPGDWWNGLPWVLATLSFYAALWMLYRVEQCFSCGCERVVFAWSSAFAVLSVVVAYVAKLGYYAYAWARTGDPDWNHTFVLWLPDAVLEMEWEYGDAKTMPDSPFRTRGLEFTRQHCVMGFWLASWPTVGALMIWATVRIGIAW